MRATGRNLTEGEREKFMEVQHQANRWTYLGTGMTHPNFLATLDNLTTGGEETRGANCAGFDIVTNRVPVNVQLAVD